MNARIEMAVGIAAAVGDPEPLPIEDAAELVREIRRLRARVAELETGTEWALRWGPDVVKPVETEKRARALVRHVVDAVSGDHGSVVCRRVGPWVDALSVPSGEET